MKLFYLLLLFIVFNSYSLYSQTGTIKVTKPKAINNDTIIKKKPKYLRVWIEAGANYSFKNNNKVGYNVEISFPTYINVGPESAQCSIGIKYAVENQYYQLSSYNKALVQAEPDSGKSENRSSYLSIPFKLTLRIIELNPSYGLAFSLGLTPEYLLKTKNQFGRLNESDYHRFNLAGCFSLIYTRPRMGLALTYSKDFYNNLKDKNIYNSTGLIVGTQRSKTNLLMLTLQFRIFYKRL